MSPADTDLTARLADAIMDSYGDASAEQLAAALLPVVREYADQRAVEELDAAAGDPGWCRWHGSYISEERLRARAAALRGDAGR